MHAAGKGGLISPPASPKQDPPPPYYESGSLWLPYTGFCSSDGTPTGPGNATLCAGRGCFEPFANERENIFLLRRRAHFSAEKNHTRNAQQHDRGSG